MMDEEENNDLGADFEDDFAEDPFEEFDTGSGQSFRELIQTNPLAKLGVVAGGFLVIMLVLSLMGEDEPQSPSMVNPAAQVTQAPGTSEEVSPAYTQAVQEKNVEEVERAIKEGSSALPVPVSQQAVGRVELTEAAETEDPLERWRRIQEERQRQEASTADIVSIAGDGEGQDVNADAIQKLAEAMAQQMTSVLSAQDPETYQAVKISAPTYMQELREEEQQRLDAAAKEAAEAANIGPDGKPLAQVVNIILPAGTIEYAQLITEANSDAPGPILAQLVSGPLAGSRLLGTFTVEEEYLVLEFQVAVIDGVSYTVSSLAIDPATTSTGLVTEKDGRYFKRVVLPAAAAFIEGMGSAIAEAGSTSVTVEGGAAVSSSEDLDTKEEIAKGVEEASKKISEIVDEEAQRVKPMIKVAAGTPLGILFTEPVTEQSQ